MVEGSVGVALAPALQFEDFESSGVLTVVTDAFEEYTATHNGKESQRLVQAPVGGAAVGMDPPKPKLPSDLGEVSGRSSRGLMESHYARRRWRACIMIREAAAGAEENAKDFDARALRIGGATDLYHLFTANEAERIISDRGRWKSDIKDLYSRLSATSTLESSAIMADAKGVDLEAFRHGYHEAWEGPILELTERTAM
ncbi:MAG: hypothetical protein SGPRY_005210 [Prymnesium sp.]